MAEAKFPLSLIIQAVDKATAPLRALNAKIQATTAPVRKLSNSFRALGEAAGVPQLAGGFVKVVSAMRGVASEAVSLGFKLSAMATGAAYGLYRLVRGTVDAGSGLELSAKRVGLSVDAYAQLRFAAGQAGVGQEEFTSAMDKFNRSLGMMKLYTGPLWEFLSRASPRLAMQVRNAKDSGAAFDIMVRAISRIKDPALRAAAVTQVFGRGSAEMVGFLGRGSKGIAEFRKRFVELAGGQAAFAEESRKVDQVMNESETAFEGARNAMALEFYPAVTALLKEITKFLVEHRSELATWAKETGAEISAWVKSGGLTRLTKDLHDLGAAIPVVVEFLGGFKTTLELLILVMGWPLLSAIGKLSAAIYTFGWSLIFTPLGPFILALGLLGLAAFLVYKRWAMFKLSFQLLWNDIVEIFEKAWAKIKPIVDVISKPFKIAWEAIKSANAYRAPWLGPEPAPAAPGFGAEGWRPAPLVGEADRAPFRPAGANAAPGGRSEAHVIVDFNNMPRGTRVSQAPRSSTDLDLSLGYSLQTP